VNLKEVLKTLVARLNERGAEFALSGGLALKGLRPGGLLAGQEKAYEGYVGPGEKSRCFWRGVRGEKLSYPRIW
jgi:hypothetical protein